MKKETKKQYIKRIAKKGGETTLKKYGKAHYRNIQKKGVITKLKRSKCPYGFCQGTGKITRMVEPDDFVTLTCPCQEKDLTEIEQ